MSPELSGWVLSVYPDEEDGAVIWLLGDDGGRHRLTQPFKTTFYVGGERQRLVTVEEFLAQLAEPPELARTLRRDLYKGELPVLAIQAENPIAQRKLFYLLQRKFRQIRYYDANIPFPIRYGVAQGIFPMAKCRVWVAGEQRIQEIEALDSPWDIEYGMPPIRTMTIRPDCDPKHAMPTHLRVQAGENEWTLEIGDGRRLLGAIDAMLQDHDPDLILAAWGDGWLFPYLMETAKKFGVDFNPNRDLRKKPLIKAEMTFESYGSIYHRASQTHLYGRWHIDAKNSTMDMGFNFSLHSAIEMARVTNVSVQTAARNSPGSGFTAMQIREALQRGVLVPLHKRQTERYKSAMDLNLADSGGLNYRPVVGLHRDVAEIDFFSMYPSITSAWNISGETVGVAGGESLYVPQTGAPIRQDVPGLVATVLKPLLEKRLAVKKMLAAMEPEDARRPIFQSIADALKWLGYVSFGYQGYKNNLFGNIQAHEAITALGREMLTRAKEAAHDLGYKVLGANTDSLFVQKAGVNTPEGLQPLLDEVLQRTGLVIELEGIFQWLAFLPSKLNPRIGASNRYFGKFYNGKLKVRGMAQRRGDTPKWIADAEREIMALLASEADTDRLGVYVPRALDIVRNYFAELDAERVALDDLVSNNKLTRELDKYRGNSPAAKAARQLAAAGKQVRVGQRVSFVYTQGAKSSVYAWDQPGKPTYAIVNKGRYKELLLRSVHQILLPLGLNEVDLANLVFDHARQLELWPEEGRDGKVGEGGITLAEVLFDPFIRVK
ncbi:MAG: hypothetical protein OEZ02_01285 [Anaerolineae bacterium]|nr:hypothetical protein [Anaerolineae bacterium]